MVSMTRGATRGTRRDADPRRRFRRQLRRAPARAEGRNRMLGQVATLGRFKGIAEIPGIHLWGFPGWFVARTYHLYQLPLFTRKVRVVADWTVALFFRRDIVELSMLGQQRHLDD